MSRAFFSQRARSVVFTCPMAVYRASAALNLPSFARPASSKPWPLQNSRRMQSFSLPYPTTGLPSRNHTGWPCQTLFSASGRFAEISPASRLAIFRSSAARDWLYFLVSACNVMVILREMSSQSVHWLRVDEDALPACKPGVHASVTRSAVGPQCRIAMYAFQREPAPLGHGPRARIALVGDQLDANGAQLIQRPVDQRRHALGGVSAPTLAGADPVADFGPRNGPVRAVQADRGHESAGVRAEGEIRQVGAQQEGGLGLATSHLRGLQARLRHNPGQEP